MKLHNQVPMEVELNARDLHEMGPVPTMEQVALGVPAKTTKSIASTPAAPNRSSPPQYGLTVMGILSLAVVGSIALGAHFKYSKPEPIVQVQNPNWTPLPERPQVVEEEEPPAAPKPTLYRNPFDKTEVFELPPGLTQAEAKEMVAEILLERARERTVSRRK
jgi:hypothetical protein